MRKPGKNSFLMPAEAFPESNSSSRSSTRIGTPHVRGREPLRQPVETRLSVVDVPSVYSTYSSTAFHLSQRLGAKLVRRLRDGRQAPRTVVAHHWATTRRTTWVERCPVCDRVVYVRTYLRRCTSLHCAAPFIRSFINTISIKFQFNFISFTYLVGLWAKEATRAVARRACVAQVSAHECSALSGCGACGDALPFRPWRCVSKFLGGSRRLPHSNPKGRHAPTRRGVPHTPAHHSPAAASLPPTFWGRDIPRIMGPTTRGSLRMPLALAASGIRTCEEQKNSWDTRQEENWCQCLKIHAKNHSSWRVPCWSKDTGSDLWEKPDRTLQPATAWPRQKTLPPETRSLARNGTESYTFGLVAEVKSHGAGTSGRSSIAPKWHLQNIW